MQSIFNTFLTYSKKRTTFSCGLERVIKRSSTEEDIRKVFININVLTIIMVRFAVLQIVDPYHVLPTFPVSHCF